MRILVIDHSTIKGHHSLYLNAVLRSFQENDPNSELFLCTADNQNFEFHPAVNKENITMVSVGFSVRLRLILLFLRVLFFRNAFRLIQIIQLNFWKRNLNIDHIFFAHLDSFIDDSTPIRYYKKLSVPWSGIFLHPFRVKEDQRREHLQELLKIRNLHRILVLDELLYKQCPKHSKVKHLPELLMDMEVNEVYLEELIKGKRNRAAIGLIGSLVKRKNLIDFLELCDGLNPESYYVILEGHLPGEKYSDDEMNIIIGKINSLSSKGMIHFSEGYIKDELTFNALYQASDILWLNYQDHPYTSNAIIKAMYLGKKVISNTSCSFIQYVTQRYNYPLVNYPCTFSQLAGVISAKIDKDKHEEFIVDYSFDRFKEIIGESVRTND